MKKTHSTRVFWSALFALVACGDNLIADPSFDLWCNGKLCKPWSVTGKVSRVKTWHRNDYGVSLGDGAVLSQASKHDRVDCIAFEVIADVSASADVWLEMDFRDDKSSEYKQLVPESHFAKLRYLVKTPTWYDSLRFILRKKGKGRAVLAQIKAQPSDECKGDALPLDARPLGAGCEKDDQCDGTVCGAAPSLFSAGLANSAVDTTLRSCGECSKTQPCAAGQVCGAAGADAGAYRTCIAKASRDVGMWCLEPSECKSEECLGSGPLTHGSCAECAADDECAADQVCGVDLAAFGVHRGCVTPALRTLGELCVVDAECSSGVCSGDGACSECSDTQACKHGDKCGMAEAEWLTVEASLCQPGAASRKHGDACTSDTDCVSGQCHEPDPICQLCVGAGCADLSTDDCGFLRRLAGTCR